MDLKILPNTSTWGMDHKVLFHRFVDKNYTRFANRDLVQLENGIDLQTKDLKLEYR